MTRLEDTLPLLKALADPTRLRVVALLAGGPRCACVLQAEVDVAANLLSHHLRVLREAGVVEATRRGRWVDYRLRAQALTELRSQIARIAGADALAVPAPATSSAAPPGGQRRARVTGAQVHG